MHTVYLALGSNVGDRKKNIAHALALLSEMVSGIVCAPIYESRAVGYQNQDHFLNTVARGETDLEPLSLLLAVKKVEQDVGRIERFKWGPREMDIDIILYDSIMFDDANLHIPHESMHERDFVLRPLADLVPDLIHPKLGVSIKDLLQKIQKQNISIIS